jgi:glycerol-3-phosphate acyltransferase PlsY
MSSRVALAAVLAYLIGAVPIGFMVARAFGVGDIRRHGSGTIGMTNVLRTAGTLPAVMTLLGDVVKGALAVLIGAAVAQAGVLGAAVCAVAAVVGNCWPVFLRFRGGKGVATGLGALLPLVPLALVPAVAVFAVVVATTRFVSLGSLLATAGVPLAAFVFGYAPPAVAAVFAIAVIVVARHHANIGRLLAGTESRIDQRVSRA